MLNTISCAPQTREGNEVYPVDCGLRETIRVNSNSICADCKHVADMCKGIRKRKNDFNGYTEINECEGFEPIST